jgi:hypothetical protein
MLKHASIIISLSLAGLYALGITFHQGFLRELGVEETQFVLTVDRVFFQGFISSMDMGIKGLFYLFMSAAGVVLVSEVGRSLGGWIYKTDLYSLLEGIFESQQGSQHSDNTFVNFAFKIFAYICLAILMCVLLLAALTMSDKSGEEYAKKYIANASKGLLHKKLIELKGEDIVYEGYSIICSPQQCAYFVDSKSVVLNNRDVSKVTDLGKKPYMASKQNPVTK